MAQAKPWKSWSTEAESYGLLWCASHLGCPSGVSRIGHINGRVDNYGQLHWIGFGKTRSTSRGVRTFLMLVGLALNRKWRYEPYWRRLYLLHRWAYLECQRRWHRRMVSSHLEHDVIRAQAEMLRLGITKSDMGDAIYLWYWRLGYAPYTRQATPKPFRAWHSRSRYDGDTMAPSTEEPTR